MPRQARLYAPGLLNHAIVKGIEPRKIFKDHIDRINFIERLGKVLRGTHTRGFAWALPSSQLRLLLPSGNSSLSIVRRGEHIVLQEGNGMIYKYKIII